MCMNNEVESILLHQQLFECASIIVNPPRYFKVLAVNDENALLVWFKLSRESELVVVIPSEKELGEVHILDKVS